MFILLAKDALNTFFIAGYFDVGYVVNKIEKHTVEDRSRTAALQLRAVYTKTTLHSYVVNS